MTTAARPSPLTDSLREFDDHRLSPFTGWTRDHWAALADRLLLSARRYASASHARVSFPGAPGGYGADVDALEGFARTFLAAGFRVAGEGGHDPLGLMEWYAEGIAAGTDPHSPERWVRLDEHHQAKVEAASIALVLHLTRPWLWDRLTPTVREQVVDYLSPAIGSEYPPINWIWFQIVVEQFLASVGGPFDDGDIDDGLALADGFARDGGWYADGPERSYDHYAGWALHFYPLLWSEMAAGDPRAESRRPAYLRHLEQYLHDAVHLVGADGSPLVQGRSLTYRFAAAAQFWSGARAGVRTPAPGLLRRAASGVVRHFAEHGAPDADGVLTLGWHGPWRPIAQSYSGPGSPYWAAKGFLGLALPADHPVWTAVEEPLPVESGDYGLVVPSAGWLVTGTRRDGVVRATNHGTDHSRPGSHLTDSPLYARLGYSTATSPVLAGEHAEHPLDQSVVLLDALGRPSHRTGFETLAAGRLPSGTLTGGSRWRAHWVDPERESPDHGLGRSGPVRLGPWICVFSVVRGAWEVRLVRLSAPAAGERGEGHGGGHGGGHDGGHGGGREVRRGEGHAGDHTGEQHTGEHTGEHGEGRGGEEYGVLRVGGWPLPALAAHASPALATGASHVGAPHVTGEGTAENGRLRSQVVGGPGLEASGVTSAGAASPLAPWTLVPWCATRAQARLDTWYEAAVFLGWGDRPDDGSADHPDDGSAARVDRAGRTATPDGPGGTPAVAWTGPSAARVTWPDGTADEIELPSPPTPSADR
ncbi:hypothetical protein FHS43_004330 [Streptosporangium becharense]|uniref:DUF2264 domain-containing protein n=1 Tax=Streptosporangium becharense TaxID=1816182 RepID=A0A7W9MEU1_9ACTN|nr:DUF2264 domain-containing protein [Streptosporangium becharense]MBB2913035.1 hypothetical protein [Streptosporangium becharense]MBB5818140.1 hypothetical protein [Streptosporangium becharense]